MQSNFVELAGPAFKQKVVNDHVLIWDESLQGYVLPLPVPGKVRLLLDEETGVFLPVANEADVQPAPIARACALKKIEEYELEYEVQRARARVESVEILRNLGKVVQVGGGLAILVFGFTFLGALIDAATAIAAMAVLALSQFVYYAMWAVCLFFGLVFCGKLFSNSAQSGHDPECPPLGNNRRNEGGGDVFISVQNGTENRQTGVAQHMVNSNIGRQ